jgi:hypothetical protein
MTDSDWAMAGVYLVVLMGAVLLLSAMSMRGTKLRLSNVGEVQIGVTGKTPDDAVMVDNGCPFFQS